MKNTFAKLGWRSSKGKDMDSQKVDFTYRLGDSEIDIQLKSRNLDIHNRWNWVILKRGRKEMAFYGEPYDFLFLVGTKLEKKGNIYSETIEPQIALIPGAAVVEYFNEQSPKSGVIGLSKKKLANKGYNYWNRYFGIENICKTLEETKKQAEEDTEILKRHRNQKRF